MHSTGRAMDFRIDGVKNEDVVAFCKTINDTGCGFYPNSSFVHMDVREAGNEPPPGSMRAARARRRAM